MTTTHDFVSASRAFSEAPEEIQRLHNSAVAYANSHWCSYSDALRSLSACVPLKASETANVTIGRPLELTPCEEFLFLPFGRVSVQDDPAGWNFTPAYARAMVSAFKQLSRPLVIDYEHQTMSHIFPQFKSPDGTAPAAGWIGDFEIRTDGLWATKVGWTVRAMTLLKVGEYRYFSPVIFWQDHEWGKPKALGPVALTNDPKLNDQPALAAKCTHADVEAMLAGPVGPLDYVSASKAFAGAAPETRQLHLVAVAYAAAAGCGYAEAVAFVSAAANKGGPR